MKCLTCGKEMRWSEVHNCDPREPVQTTPNRDVVERLLDRAAYLAKTLGKNPSTEDYADTVNELASEIRRLREALDAAEKERDEARKRAESAERWSSRARDQAWSDADNTHQRLYHEQVAKMDALERERDQARERVHDLECFLRRNDFVECDIPACNCGSWHKAGEKP